MGSLKDTFSTVSGWFGDFVSLGLSLAMVFLVVDALFGGGTSVIVDNGADLVGAFTDNVITGLVAFVIFMSIWGSNSCYLQPEARFVPPPEGGANSADLS